MMLKPASRRLLAPAVLVSVALTLSGCGAGAGGGAGEFTRDREGAVEMPVAPPETFVTKAKWSAPHAEGAPVILAGGGVVTFEAAGAGEYRTVMLDPRDGSRVWASHEVLVSPEGAPSLHAVQDGGREWVVAVVQTPKDKTATVTVYEPLRSGDILPWKTRTFEPESKTAPRLVVGDGGVLVIGAKGAPLAQYHPGEDEVAELPEAPTKGKERGEPLAVFQDGLLASVPGGGFAYVLEHGGWQSSRVAPEGVDASKGQVLGSGAGLVVVLWPGKGGGQQVWVHDLTTGRAVAGGPADGKITADGSTPVVVSAERDRAFWGEFMFDLAEGGMEVLDLRGGTAVSARAGVVYAEDAKEPLEGGPQEGFRGLVGWDWRKGAPVEGQVQSTPQVFSVLGQGVFAEGGEVFAVNLD